MLPRILHRSVFALAWLLFSTGATPLAESASDYRVSKQDQAYPKLRQLERTSTDVESLPSDTYSETDADLSKTEEKHDAPLQASEERRLHVLLWTRYLRAPDVVSVAGQDQETKVLRRAERELHPNRMYWHFENVRQHVSEATTSSHKEVWSEKVVVGGYTTRISLDINRIDGELWLGAYLNLCPGPKDSFLQWPFRTPYSLTILHPTSSKKDIQGKKTDFRADSLPYFKRPKGSCNSNSRGWKKIIRVEEAEREGYVFEDAMSILLTLYP